MEYTEGLTLMETGIAHAKPFSLSTQHNHNSIHLASMQIYKQAVNKRIEIALWLIINLLCDWINIQTLNLKSPVNSAGRWMIL